MANVYKGVNAYFHSLGKEDKGFLNGDHILDLVQQVGAGRNDTQIKEFNSLAEKTLQEQLTVQVLFQQLEAEAHKHGLNLEFEEKSDGTVNVYYVPEAAIAGNLFKKEDLPTFNFSTAKNGFITVNGQRTVNQGMIDRALDGEYVYYTLAEKILREQMHKFSVGKHGQNENFIRHLSQINDTKLGDRERKQAMKLIKNGVSYTSKQIMSGGVNVSSHRNFDEYKNSLQGIGSEQSGRVRKGFVNLRPVIDSLVSDNWSIVNRYKKQTGKSSITSDRAAEQVKKDIMRILSFYAQNTATENAEKEFTSMDNFKYFKNTDLIKEVTKLGKRINTIGTDIGTSQESSIDNFLISLVRNADLDIVGSIDDRSNRKRLQVANTLGRSEQAIEAMKKATKKGYLHKKKLYTQSDVQNRIDKKDLDHGYNMSDYEYTVAYATMEAIQKAKEKVIRKKLKAGTITEKEAELLRKDFDNKLGNAGAHSGGIFYAEDIERTLDSEQIRTTGKIAKKVYEDTYKKFLAKAEKEGKDIKDQKVLTAVQRDVFRHFVRNKDYLGLSKEETNLKGLDRFELKNFNTGMDDEYYQIGVRANKKMHTGVKLMEGSTFAKGTGQALDREIIDTLFGKGSHVSFVRSPEAASIRDLGGLLSGYARHEIRNSHLKYDDLTKIKGGAGDFFAKWLQKGKGSEFDVRNDLFLDENGRRLEGEAGMQQVYALINALQALPSTSNAITVDANGGLKIDYSKLKLDTSVGQFAGYDYGRPDEPVLNVDYRFTGAVGRMFDMISQSGKGNDVSTLRKYTLGTKNLNGKIERQGVYDGKENDIKRHNEWLRQSQEQKDIEYFNKYESDKYNIGKNDIVVGYGSWDDNKEKLEQLGINKDNYIDMSDSQYDNPLVFTNVEGAITPESMSASLQGAIWKKQKEHVKIDQKTGEITALDDSKTLYLPSTGAFYVEENGKKIGGVTSRLSLMNPHEVKDKKGKKLIGYENPDVFNAGFSRIRNAERRLAEYQALKKQGYDDYDPKVEEELKEELYKQIADAQAAQRDEVESKNGSAFRRGNITQLGHSMFGSAVANNPSLKKAKSIAEQDLLANNVTIGDQDAVLMMTHQLGEDAKNNILVLQKQYKYLYDELTDESLVKEMDDALKAVLDVKSSASKKEEELIKLIKNANTIGTDLFEKRKDAAIKEGKTLRGLAGNFLRYPLSNGLDIKSAETFFDENMNGSIKVGFGLGRAVNLDFDGDKAAFHVDLSDSDIVARIKKDFDAEKDSEGKVDGKTKEQYVDEALSKMFGEKRTMVDYQKRISSAVDASTRSGILKDIELSGVAGVQNLGKDEISKLFNTQAQETAALLSRINKGYTGYLSNNYQALVENQARVGNQATSHSGAGNLNEAEQQQMVDSMLTRALFESFTQDAISAKKVVNRIATDGGYGAGWENNADFYHDIDRLMGLFSSSTTYQDEGSIKEALGKASKMGILGKNNELSDRISAMVIAQVQAMFAGEKGNLDKNSLKKFANALHISEEEADRIKYVYNKNGQVTNGDADHLIQTDSIVSALLNTDLRLRSSTGYGIAQSQKNRGSIIPGGRETANNPVYHLGSKLYTQEEFDKLPEALQALIKQYSELSYTAEETTKAIKEETKAEQAKISVANKEAGAIEKGTKAYEQRANAVHNLNEMAYKLKNYGAGAVYDESESQALNRVFGNPYADTDPFAEELKKAKKKAEESGTLGPSGVVTAKLLNLDTNVYEQRVNGIINPLFGKIADSLERLLGDFAGQIHKIDGTIVKDYDSLNAWVAANANSSNEEAKTLSELINISLNDTGQGNEGVNTLLNENEEVMRAIFGNRYDQARKQVLGLGAKMYANTIGAAGGIGVEFAGQEEFENIGQAEVPLMMTRDGKTLTHGRLDRIIYGTKKEKEKSFIDGEETEVDREVMQIFDKKLVGDNTKASPRYIAQVLDYIQMMERMYKEIQSYSARVGTRDFNMKEFLSNSAYGNLMNEEMKSKGYETLQTLGGKLFEDLKNKKNLKFRGGLLMTNHNGENNRFDIDPTSAAMEVLNKAMLEGRRYEDWTTGEQATLKEAAKQYTGYIGQGAENEELKKFRVFNKDVDKQKEYTDLLAKIEKQQKLVTSYDSMLTKVSVSKAVLDDEGSAVLDDNGNKVTTQKAKYGSAGKFHEYQQYSKTAHDDLQKLKDKQNELYNALTDEEKEELKEKIDHHDSEMTNIQQRGAKAADDIAKNTSHAINEILDLIQDTIKERTSLLIQREIENIQGHITEQTKEDINTAEAKQDSLEKQLKEHMTALGDIGTEDATADVNKFTDRFSKITDDGEASTKKELEKLNKENIDYYGKLRKDHAAFIKEKDEIDSILDNDQRYAFLTNDEKQAYIDRQTSLANSIKENESESASLEKYYRDKGNTNADKEGFEKKYAEVNSKYTLEEQHNKGSANERYITNRLNEYDKAVKAYTNLNNELNNINYVLDENNGMKPFLKEGEWEDKLARKQVIEPILEQTKRQLDGYVEYFSKDQSLGSLLNPEQKQRLENIKSEDYYKPLQSPEAIAAQNQRRITGVVNETGREYAGLLREKHLKEQRIAEIGLEMKYDPSRKQDLQEEKDQLDAYIKDYLDAQIKAITESDVFKSKQFVAKKSQVELDQEKVNKKDAQFFESNFYAKKARENKHIENEIAQTLREQYNNDFEIEKLQDQIGNEKNGVKRAYLEKQLEYKKEVADLHGNDYERLKANYSNDPKFGELYNRMKEMIDLEYQVKRQDYNAQQGAKGMGGAGGGLFGGKLKGGISSYFQRFIGGGLIYKIFGKLRQALTKIINLAGQLDKTMTNLRIVTNGSVDDTRNLINSYSKLAKELGSTTQEVAQSATEWLRQGYETAEVNKLVKASMHLSKLGMIDSTTATKDLTSAMKGFKIEAQDAMSIVDKLTAIDMKAATSAGDIAEGLSQFANLGSLAGVGIDEASAYVATIADVSQMSGSSAGQALKTIISRYGNVKAGAYNKLNVNSDAAESSENLNDVEKVLNKIGISIRDSNLEFREFDEVLAEIAERWDSLDTVSQKAVANAFAGVRQQEAFVTLLQNWDKYESLLDTSKNSAGTAKIKYDAYKDSLEAAKNELTATWESFVNNQQVSEFLEMLYKFANKMLEWMPQLIKYLPFLMNIASNGKLLTGQKTGFGKFLERNGQMIGDDVAGTAKGFWKGVKGIPGRTKDVWQVSKDKVKKFINPGKRVETDLIAKLEETTNQETKNAELNKQTSELNKQTSELNKQNVEAEKQSDTTDNLEKQQINQNESANVKENTLSVKEFGQHVDQDGYQRKQSGNGSGTPSAGGAPEGGKSSAASSPKAQAAIAGASYAVNQLMSGVTAYMTAGRTHTNAYGETVTSSEEAKKRGRATATAWSAAVPLVGSLIGNYIADEQMKKIDADRDAAQKATTDANEKLSTLSSTKEIVQSLGDLAGGMDSESVAQRREAANAYMETLYQDENSEVREILVDIYNSTQGIEGQDKTLNEIMQEYKDGDAESQKRIAKALEIANKKAEIQQQKQARAATTFANAEKLKDAKNEWLSNRTYDKLGSEEYKGYNSNGITDAQQASVNMATIGSGAAVAGAVGVGAGMAGVAAGGVAAALGATAAVSSAIPVVGWAVAAVAAVAAGVVTAIAVHDAKMEEEQQKAAEDRKSLQDRIDAVNAENDAIRNAIDSKDTYDSETIDLMEQQIEQNEKYLDALLEYKGYLQSLVDADNEMLIEESLLEATLRDQEGKATDKYLLDLNLQQLKELGVNEIYKTLAAQIKDKGGLFGIRTYKYGSDGELSQQFIDAVTSILKEDEEISSVLTGEKYTLNEALQLEDNYFNRKIWQNFADALGTTVDQLDEMSDSLGNLKLSELLLDSQGLTEAITNYGSLLQQLTSSSTKHSEVISTLTSQYPELLQYVGHTPDVIDKVMEKIRELNNIALQTQWNEYATSTEFFSQKFKQELLDNIRNTDTRNEAAQLLTDNNITTMSQLRTWIIGQDKSNPVIASIYKAFEEAGSSYMLAADEYKEQLQAYTEYQSDQLEKQIENLNQQKEALSEINKQREYENRLLEAKLKLENASQEKKRIYRAGVGWVYESDQAAIEEAQKNLDEVQNEKSISALEEQINILTEIQSQFANFWDLQDEEAAQKQAQAFEKEFGISGTMNNIFEQVKDLSGGVEKSLNEITKELLEKDETEKQTALEDLSTKWSNLQQAEKDVAAGKMTHSDYNSVLQEYTSAWNSASQKGYINDTSYDGWTSDKKDSNGNAAFGSEASRKVGKEGYTAGSKSIDKLFVIGDNDNQPDHALHSKGLLDLGSTYADNIFGDIRDSFKDGKKKAGIWKSDGTVIKLNKKSNSTYSVKDDDNSLQDWVNHIPIPDDGLIVCGLRGEDEWAYIAPDKQVYELAAIDDFDTSKKVWNGEYDGAKQKSAYASGTLDLNPVCINELGTEAIVTPSGTITALPSHSGIVPADITRNIWELGEVAPSILRAIEAHLAPDSIGSSNIGGTTDESFNIDNLTMNVQADKSFDADAFVESLRSRVALTRNIRN